jgi:pyrimidine operon attenuation protein/uracil phosphoribosyltransferase
LSNPVVVVCPDEEGARSLAHYFGALKGFTVVPIPRADLNAMIHDEEYAAFNTADKLWAQIIQRAASRSNIVLLEEFVVTGTTKRLLIRALAKIGKAARFHVAVAAFGMGQSLDVDSVQTLVLYSCPVGAAVA